MRNSGQIQRFAFFFSLFRSNRVHGQCDTQHRERTEWKEIPNEIAKTKFNVKYKVCANKIYEILKRLFILFRNVKQVAKHC